jgi:hypothetical protein
MTLNMKVAVELQTNSGQTQILSLPFYLTNGQSTLHNVRDDQNSIYTAEVA